MTRPYRHSAHHARVAAREASAARLSSDGVLEVYAEPAVDQYREVGFSNWDVRRRRAAAAAGTGSLSRCGRRRALWRCSRRVPSPERRRRTFSARRRTPISRESSFIGFDAAWTVVAAKSVDFTPLAETEQKPGRFRIFSIEECYDHKTCALGFERVPART